MQERHVNREKYFNEQGVTSKKYVLPFINDIKEINEDTSILEIGCGEGGNLVPFVEMGCKRVVGIDMSEGKIKNAKKLFNQMKNHDNVEFICDNIYNIDPEELGQFDIIITRDVLEHIHGQDRFLNFVKRFMRIDGKFFLGFPPWYFPFGGHQQMCKNKFLSKLPYYHILPKHVYKFILKSFGESEATIRGLLEVKETGITIERFEKLIKKNKYKIDKKSLYLINPNYEVKFGLKPKVIWKPFSFIPYLRDFYITTSYYLISDNN